MTHSLAMQVERVDGVWIVWAPPVFDGFVYVCEATLLDRTRHGATVGV